MAKKLKIFLHNNRTWVYNLQYIFISIIMLIIVTYIDYYQSIFIEYIPGFFYTRMDLAKTVLSSLSSGLLAISIFAFSSILSMLTFYSGSFSPRVVENFVGKKITMKVLGIFIGGFTYCVTSLNFMRGGDDDRLVVAGTVGILYVIICIIYLVVFIQKTIRDVQVVNLVSDIYKESMPVIINELKDRKFDDIRENYETEKYTPVISKLTGYFELFNTETAMTELNNFSGILLIPIKTGDFIAEGQEIGRLIDDSGTNLTELAEKLVSSYEVHDNKISITDYVFGIDKIKEIALMALSPGVNDPATAVHCINKLSTLLGMLAKTNEFHHIERLKNKGYIYYTSNKFSEDLYQTFSPIANYGKADAHVISTLFEGMIIISESATEDNKAKILQLATEIFDSCKENMNLKSDIKFITHTFERLNKKISDKDKIYGQISS